MTSTSLHTGKKHYMAPWVTRAESCGPGDVEAKRTLAASSTEDFLIGRWSLVFCLLARVRHQKACWKLCVCRQNMSFLNWSSWGCKPAFMFRDPQIPLSEVLFSQGTCCLFFWKESSIFLSWGTRLVVKFSEAKKKKKRELGSSHSSNTEWYQFSWNDVHASFPPLLCLGSLGPDSLWLNLSRY